MSDELFQTEHELQLFRLDPEAIRLHGKSIAFKARMIKPYLKRIRLELK